MCFKQINSEHDSHGDIRQPIYKRITLKMFCIIIFLTLYCALLWNFLKIYNTAVFVIAAAVSDFTACPLLS